MIRAVADVDVALKIDINAMRLIQPALAGVAVGPVVGLGSVALATFVLCVPLFGLIMTDDFGPLFVMMYAAAIFLGAATGMMLRGRQRNQGIPR